MHVPYAKCAEVEQWKAMLSVCTGNGARPPSKSTSSSSNTVCSCKVGIWHEYEVVLITSFELDVLTMAAERLPCSHLEDFRDIDTPV
jgi:hypothetical protein